MTEETEKKSWYKSLPPNQKKIVNFSAIAIFVITFIAVSNVINPKPTACQCIDNSDLGYYDALGDKDREVRDQCNKLYPGPATRYTECKKERGE